MTDGWICPRCGRGLAPWVASCSCIDTTISTGVVVRSSCTCEGGLRPGTVPCPVHGAVR